MKKLTILIFCFISTCALSQVLTTTTATLVDSSGQVWSQAQWTTTFIPPFGNPSPPNNQGNPITPSQSGIASTSGAFTVTLDDNNVVTPAGSKWKFTICPNASVVACTEVQLIITGPTMDISAALNAAISPPVVGSQPTIVRAYKDSEVNGSFGVFYSNVIDNTLRQCQLIECIGTGWVIVGGGGGGTGTTVQVNAVNCTSPCNFNNTTPVTPTNGKNVTWQLSGGLTSAALIGDGISTDCFIGTGIFSPCPGGATGTLSGSGTVNYLPVWTGTTTLGNSVITATQQTVQVGAAVGTPFLTPNATGFNIAGLTLSVNHQTPTCVGSGGVPTIPLAFTGIGCLGMNIVFNTTNSTNTGVNSGLLIRSNGAASSTGSLGMGITVLETGSNPLQDQRAGYFESLSGNTTTAVPGVSRGVFGVAVYQGANLQVLPLQEAIAAESGTSSANASVATDYTIHCLPPLTNTNGGTLTNHACLKIEPQVTGVEMQLGSHTFATLPPCTAAYEGSIASVTDAVVAGGGVSGGGTGHVLLYCNGTSWGFFRSTSNTQDFQFSGCPPAQSTDASCGGTVTLEPPFADTNYVPQLTINSLNGAFLAISVSGPLGISNFPYTITCTFNCSSILTPIVYVHIAHR